MGAGKTASTLRAALSQCADRIQVAFVYGYVARSQPKAGSDIDLFVVGLVNFGDGRQDYLKRLSDLVLAEISVVSTGPDRTQTTTLPEAAIIALAFVSSEYRPRPIDLSKADRGRR